MAKINRYFIKGFKPIGYVKRSTGEIVSGCEIYLQAEHPDEKVVGDQLEAVYLNDKYSDFTPDIGMYVKKVYNQWGRVEDLELIL